MILGLMTLMLMLISLTTKSSAWIWGRLQRRGKSQIHMLFCHKILQGRSLQHTICRGELYLCKMLVAALNWKKMIDAKLHSLLNYHSMTVIIISDYLCWVVNSMRLLPLFFSYVAVELQYSHFKVRLPKQICYDSIWYFRMDFNLKNVSALSCPLNLSKPL